MEAVISKINCVRNFLPVVSRTRIACASQTSISSGRQEEEQENVVGQFPIHRIYCVGRNYREHAIEMGGDPDREPPFFFQKPSDAAVSTADIVDSSSSYCRKIPYPPMTSSLHFEGELVVAIHKAGLRIEEDDAMEHVLGYAVACDLTRRDLQAQAKSKGRPWEAAKAFDFSAPCGPILLHQHAHLTDTTELVTRLDVQVRQRTTLDRMIWNIPQIISHLSQYFKLQPGDLIMTGTPAGVADIQVGQSLQITCGNLPPCQFTMDPPE